MNKLNHSGNAIRIDAFEMASGRDVRSAKILRSLVSLALVLAACAMGFGQEPVEEPNAAARKGSRRQQATHQSNAASPPASFRNIVRQAQAKLVKIVGGEVNGWGAYQSGVCISEDGYILTSWSYVLEADVTVTLGDGQKFPGTLVGYDPQLEIAILKIDANGLSHFKLDSAVTAKLGARVLAFSNLYGVATGDEPVSVQTGVVSALTKLSSRRGAFESAYTGDVYLVDAIINMQEMLDGKTIVQDRSNEQKPSEPMTLSLLGLVLIPDVVDRTPPFIDRIVAGAATAEAGLRPDDLVISVNRKLCPSVKDLKKELEYVDRDSKLLLTVRRNNDFIEVEISL